MAFYGARGVFLWYDYCCTAVTAIFDLLYNNEIVLMGLLLKTEVA